MPPASAEQALSTSWVRSRWDGGHQGGGSKLLGFLWPSRSAAVSAGAEYHRMQSTSCRLKTTPYTVCQLTGYRRQLLVQVGGRGTGAPPVLEALLPRPWSAGTSAAGATQEHVLPSNSSFCRLQCPQNAHSQMVLFTAAVHLTRFTVSAECAE